MAVNTFKATIWSALLLTALQNNLVGEAFVNHQYEGEVQGAGSVKINTLGDISVKEYNGNDINYDALNTTDQTLNIDYQRYFSFYVNDVDKAQVRSGGELMTKAMANAAYAIANDADKKTFSTIVDGAGVTLAGKTSPVDISSSNQAKNILLQLNKAADKANVPAVGRVVAISPDFKALLLGDKYLGLNTAVSDGIVKQGYVGELYGLQLYVTNNLPAESDGTTYAVLTHSNFTTEAHQIEKIEALRSQTNFNDLVRGLFVSGRKVTRPEGVIKIALKFSDGTDGNYNDVTTVKVISENSGEAEG